MTATYDFNGECAASDSACYAESKGETRKSIQVPGNLLPLEPRSGSDAPLSDGEKPRL